VSGTSVILEAREYGSGVFGWRHSLFRRTSRYDSRACQSLIATGRGSRGSAPRPSRTLGVARAWSTPRRCRFTGRATPPCWRRPAPEKPRANSLRAMIPRADDRRPHKRGRCAQDGFMCDLVYVHHMPF